MSAHVVLSARGLEKSYGRVQALRGASIDLHASEVVAIVGDNAAGKSTLLKSLSGVVIPDEGSLDLGGQPVQFDSPRDARQRGVEVVHQDLALCDNLSVYENIFLPCPRGRGVGRFRILDRRRMRTAATEALQRLGMDLGDTRIPVTALSGGQRQFVAIARATIANAKVVLFDEPTAALSVAGTQRVHDVIRQLSVGGTAVAVVSHDLNHVMEVADRIVVMRHGRAIASLPGQAVDPQEVVGLMTGAIAPKESTSEERDIV